MVQKAKVQEICPLVPPPALTRMWGKIYYHIADAYPILESGSHKIDFSRFP